MTPCSISLRMNTNSLKVSLEPMEKKGKKKEEKIIFPCWV